MRGGDDDHDAFKAVMSALVFSGVEVRVADEMIVLDTYAVYD